MKVSVLLALAIMALLQVSAPAQTLAPKALETWIKAFAGQSIEAYPTHPLPVPHGMTRTALLQQIQALQIHLPPDSPLALDTAFTLAYAGVQRQSNLVRLTHPLLLYARSPKLAILQFRALYDLGTGFSYCTSSLAVLYMQRSDPALLKTILQTRLDGGPAEILADTDAYLLLHATRPAVRLARQHAMITGNLVDAIVMASPQDQRRIKLRLTGVGKTDPFARVLWQKAVHLQQTTDPSRKLGK